MTEKRGSLRVRVSLCQQQAKHALAIPGGIRSGVLVQDC